MFRSPADSQVQHQRADVLPLAQEVRQPRGFGAQAAQGAEGGESSAQGPGCRSEPRQTDPPRGAGKKSLKAAKRRELVNWAREKYFISARHGCSILQLARSSYYYKNRLDARVALRMRLRELAAVRPRFGYRRLHLLLRREGWQVNHKVIHRLYCEEDLQVRTRKRRKISSRPRLTASSSGDSESPVVDGFCDRQLRRRAAVSRLHRDRSVHP